LKVKKSIIGRIAMLLAVLAIIGVAGLIGGCVSINPGSLTVEHREDRTLQPAADNIVLNVSTINGNVEIREMAGRTDVEITFDIIATEGHLLHVLTSTNGTRIDNNTVMITAEAKLMKQYEGEVATHGANIIVTVPQGSHYELNLNTLNGDIKVPALNGGSLIAGTMNGNVEITGGNYSTIDARSSNGDVTVKLQEGTLFYVDASTMNGRVRHGNIHMSPTAENDRTLTGSTEAGNGSLRMSLHTMNGNVEISY
jgi:DUF4097 and DUF4098 domain-containing protein YvlB